MLKNILIIDDDERLRELLDEYLTEKNYKIYHSDDFNSGKEILEYFIFDLVIVDRMMPSGDGINLISLITSTPYKKFFETAVPLEICYFKSLLSSTLTT